MAAESEEIPALPSSVPSLPAVYALHLAQGVKLCGGSDTQLLAELGIPVEQLSDPSARIGLVRMQGLILRAMELCGEPGLGIVIGWNTSISNFGMLGFAALAAPKLRDAVDIAVRFVPSITNIARVKLEVADGRATIELEELHPFRPVREFLAALPLIALARLGEALTGAPIAGTVEFGFPDPGYFSRFPPEHTARVRFDQPAHRLVFDAIELDRPILTADPAAYRTALELCQRQLVELKPGALLVQRVSHELFAADGGVRSARQVARSLAMADRTLKRKLAEQGTSYSDLLDRQRHMRAIELLRGDASIEAIAERLGYSDAANFTRAFRRWTGTSPRAARKATHSR